MNDAFPIIYGLKRKDYGKRLESQSGGAFSVIAEYFLQKGAIVYACGYDIQLNVVYKRIDSLDGLSTVKGSKYVRANLGNTFINILDDLKKGNDVLFIGSACYVAGLKQYLCNSPYKDKLYTVDFICHGTPSHAVYREYLNMVEKESRKKIVGFNFRVKFPGGVEMSHGTDRV